MLRNDGKYEIYILEFSNDSKDFHQVSFDGGFVYGKRWYADGSGKEHEPHQSFSASGKCWQETGIHGTYDVETAIKLYCILMQNNPKYMFRVIKKTISQESEILWCGQKGKNVVRSNPD